jgi:multiple sugar transport system ATP-binding protein
MVFQSYALYPHLTVFENIAFPLRLRKVREPELRRRVEETAARLDLGALLERRPAQLSGGQRQRVAMGRALVREARAFQLDEPLSNLDARLRTELRAEIRRLQRALGVTTLHVTHDQTEALTLGDRVAVLRAGRLEQVAAPEALYGRPANLFVAGFVGSPAMNFFPARVEAGELVLPFARAPLPAGRALPPGGALVAGLRPEHLERATEGAGVTFRARVELVEWLGDRQLLHVPWEAPAGPELRGSAWQELGAGAASRLVAAVGAEPAVRAGEVIALRFDPSRLHLFDASSGAALR